MKKTTLILIALMSLSGIFTISCQSGDPRFPGFDVAENGLIYKFNVEGDSTVSPVVGEFVTVVLTYGKKDSVLFDSRNIPQEMIIPMMESQFKGDLYNGIGMMQIGDSATFVLPADSVFKYLFGMPNTPPEFANDFLYFNVKLTNIQTQAEVDAARQAEMDALMAEETKVRDEYLALNYPEAVPTETGLYYIEETAGKGPNPQNGQKVSVHYVGKFLDGTQFDSSVERGQPLEFVLGQQAMIPGLEQGVLLMKKGGKATLVVPSLLAYGPGRPGIPPFSTLVFNVELLDFSDEK